jgi:hypothetical protein
VIATLFLPEPIYNVYATLVGGAIIWYGLRTLWRFLRNL